MTEIDIEQFEGHTAGPWDKEAPLGIELQVGLTISRADSNLMASAPDLLEEVKRLRENMASDLRNTAKLVTECENECTCGASDVFADGY